MFNVRRIEVDTIEDDRDLGPVDMRVLRWACEGDGEDVPLEVLKVLEEWLLVWAERGRTEEELDNYAMEYLNYIDEEERAERFFSALELAQRFVGLGHPEHAEGHPATHMSRQHAGAVDSPAHA